MKMKEIKKLVDSMQDHQLLYAQALIASRLFADYTHVNETAYTGWGDQVVPPRAEFMRVKAEQACKALRDAS